MRAIRFFAALLLTLAASRALPQSADAVLLVNSTSSRYADAQRYIRPYLDHFGVPYTVLDIATASVGPEIANHALIIVGHASLDPGHLYLDATEQANLSNAVLQGSGLVDFDNDLTPDGSTARYQYVQDVFGFGYRPGGGGEGVFFTSDAPRHYVSSRHAAGEAVAARYMAAPVLDVPASGTVLARIQTTGDPLLVVTSYGLGHALQWASYDWMSYSTLGPMYPMDDLVWRGLAWAARKPFVMQGLPNFLTMRVDDATGGFWWVRIANEFQLKPWLGLFYWNISEPDASDLSALVNGGLATASVHARTSGDFFYYDHYAQRNYSDSTIASYYQDATTWHNTHGIPVSKFVLPHFYEFGTNVFSGLQNWGVQFVGTHMSPGQPFYGSPWLMLGPYRLYETGGASDAAATTYADYLPIPGHPELANRFFNCVTEIRDDAGYEWSPDGSDVVGSIGRGTRQTKRAFDGMALATLFTHEYNIQPFTEANWRSTLAAIVNNLASYNPIFVTLDYACQYLRAKHDSKIVSSVFDPATQTLTTDLSGTADVATQFYVFTGSGDAILQTAAGVPAFSGTTRVAQSLGGALAQIVVSPSSVTLSPGSTQQFVAQGYDAAGNPILGLTPTWSATAGGTIDQSGRFTAGPASGTFPNAVSATTAGVTGYASVEVLAVPLDITTTTLPAGVENQAYAETLAAVGGTPPYAWSLTSGTLPTGLGFSTGGVISGTPTAVGTFSFTVMVTDAAFRTSARSLSISIVPAFGLSIWPTTATPGNVDHGADSAVELGVKFRSDVSGAVTGIRFYKASTNTGTHVGNLWASSGQLLASATFTNESASGWQQVNFATPVSISANTVYVASYHTNVGHYSQDMNFFASAGYDNAPLHALSSPAAGGNGVYAYGSTSSFPSDTWYASNYWVDVVFSAGPAPTLSSITVTPANPTIAAGATQQFTATGTYSDGSTQDITGQVTWASSSTAVATIDAAGLATAVAGGTATISATQGSITGGATLAVTPRVASVVVTPATARLAAGATQQFSAAGYDSQGTAIPGLTFTWSATAGGTITQSGLFTAGSTAGAFSNNVVASTGGVSGAASTEVVALSALALAPTVVVEGDTSTGTVTLSGPAPADVTVGLSSSSAAATVPASVVVPAGAVSATFAVGTYAVTATTSATITASAGGLSRTATLSVRALALTLSPTSVLGGNNSTGTLTLSASMAVPVTVALSSNNPAAAVPASLTIAAGATTATFTVTTSPVAANTLVTIAATNGMVASTATLTVTAAAFRALTVNPTGVVEGDPSTGTVTLSGPAPALGATLTLSSNNVAATVPSSVTVPAGGTTATFPITTSAVSAGVSVTISATYGATTRTATLGIRNMTLSLSPTTVGGGNTSTATLRLSATVTTATTATLSTSNPAVATVPASVTVAAGATTATFVVSTSTVTGTTPVSITATHAGITASANLSVRVISPSSVRLNPTSVVGGSPSTGTVTLNYAAPSGGYTVTLASSRTAVATVPASVVVPTGSTSTTFPVTSYPVASNTSSSISASGGGVTRSATLTVTAPAVSALALSPTTVTSGATSVATVTLNGPAPSAGRIVTLSSSNTAVATVPASVTVPAGATNATFTVTAMTVTATSTATISAAAGGATATAVLTVNP